MSLPSFCFSLLNLKRKTPVYSLSLVYMCTVKVCSTRVASKPGPLCAHFVAYVPVYLLSLTPMLWFGTSTMSDTLFFLQQGVRFDPDLPQTIRLEFAKSNTKVSKPKQMLAPQAVTQPPLVHPLTGRK